RRIQVRPIEPVAVVLDRIRHESSLDPSPRFALVPEPLVSERRLQDVVVVRVVAELHVAPQIPCEAALVDDARREPTGRGARLEDVEAVEAELLEPMGDT